MELDHFTLPKILAPVLLAFPLFLWPSVFPNGAAWTPQGKGGEIKPAATPAPAPKTDTAPAKPRAVPNTFMRQIVGNWAWPENPRVVYVFSPDGTGKLLPSNTGCTDFRYQIEGDLLVMTGTHHEDCKDNEERKETARLNISGNDMKLTYPDRPDTKRKAYWLVRTTGSNELAIRFHIDNGGSRPPYKISSIVRSGVHVEFMSPLVVIDETICCRKVVKLVSDPRPDEYETFVQMRGFRSPVSGTVIRTFVTDDQEINADALLLIIRKD